MEFELFTECAGDDYVFGAEDIENEYPTFEGDEGERCGICMDVVVDRGVLDCCQHWFCFACIDNWASITNLCPLCQNEFQLITCVPVYDTIGSSQPDEDLYSRDDEWCVEGNNNTLSFPSYYIDENAVSCLEGDDCKIRSQSANVEEDPNLDTSIACDSCDLWYHAICVGFDPDGSCETSWLCPRCLANETPLKSESGPSGSRGPESSSCEHSVDATFPMKVSVSVADAGETAVVVSIIDCNQQTEVPRKNLLSSSDLTKDSKVENQGNEEPKQITLPSSNVREDVRIDKKIVDDNCKLEKQLTEKIIKKPKIEAVELDLSSSQGTASALPSKSSLLSGSRRNVEDKKTDKFEETGEVQEKDVSKERTLPVPADKKLDKKDNAVAVTGAKRKQRDYRNVDEGDTKAKMQHSTSAKKVKTERSRITHSKDQAEESIPNLRSARAGSENRTMGKQKATTDIKDIVQGTYRRPSKLLDKSSEGKEATSGLRVKKIMRRTTENKESSEVVQNLRKEIRDAIRNRSSKELGDNLFDPKLLAAFRTALAGQTTETKRPPPLDLKAKKALLQKGTVRENLTKKIYGIGGKRKRAWTRDCEIEFWKHRCSKVSRPEKVETLKSVLNLLRKGPETTDIKQENNVETRSSILSRLYVADASVLPRKDDIKPLSALKVPEQSKPSLTEKTSIPSAVDSCVSVRSSNSSVDGKGAKVIVPGKKIESANRKVNSNTASSPVNAQKESGHTFGNLKVDKKKWALEVLARKTAVMGNNAAQGQDKAVLKGNYPLLAQLPVDMRPVLASSQHNKIPISIRQAQLYRLTEHFLRKANMPVARPTAEIELAVADAINVEKAVANRSNSKLVYVNLCSQELLHRSDDRNLDPKPSTVLGDNLETTGNDSSSKAEVNDALRNAGLLSDSPPNSPYTKEEMDVSPKIKEDGPDNVFEMDSQPELDIYGDFEYDLEEDDFVGSSVLKPSKLQNDESKIKLVFSTLESERSDSAWHFENGNADDTTEKSLPKLPEGGEEENLGDCEELYGPDKEPIMTKYPEIKPLDLVPENVVAEANNKKGSDLEAKVSTKTCSESVVDNSSGGMDLPEKARETMKPKEKKSEAATRKSDKRNSVFKKVEAYIKEHIRPLCKSGVITIEQYRWAVGKTTDKIMKYHSKDSNANFLIKEGEKVKKLAEQYVEAAQKAENNK